MADVQIVRPTVEDVPAVYTLPGAAEFTLKAVYAFFDGSGTGSSWTPAVTILSDSGHTIAFVADKSILVAGGDDAEVSWFPGVKGSGAGGLAARRPVLFLVGTASGVQTSVTGVGFRRQFYQAGGFSYQPDTAVYSVNNLGGGLCDEVTFLQAGQYMITAGFIYESAAAFHREWSLRLFSAAGLPLPEPYTEANDTANDVQRGLAQIYEATTTAVAGGSAGCRVEGVQTSGGNVGVAGGYLSIIQLSNVAQ